jgi:hypothetical protein
MSRSGFGINTQFVPHRAWNEFRAHAKALTENPHRRLVQNRIRDPISQYAMGQLAKPAAGEPVMIFDISIEE